MRYVRARLNTSQRDLTYRIYVTDALKILGGLNIRWYDYLDRKEPSKPSVTSEQAIGGIKNKLAMN